MKLRPYQRTWAKRALEHDAARVLMVGPTGAGKTVVAAYMIQTFARQGKRVLFLAHRRELIQQASDRLAARGAQGVGVVRPGGDTPDARVLVSSVQTAARRVLPEADIVFVDEAHHVAACTYKGVIDAHKGARVYGLTATPIRLDGKPLDAHFDAIVEGPSVEALISKGALSKPRVFSWAPDLSGVRVTAGDLNKGGASQVMRERKLVGDAVSHWKRFTPEWQTVVYAVDVKHAETLVRAFKRVASSVALLTGKTPAAERAAILEDFAAKRLRVIVNVEVLTEGWDCAGAECCVFARPTMSEALALQVAGRFMRPSKRRPVIFDHGGNFTRFAHPSEARVKMCPSCGSHMRGSVRVCDFCEHEFWTHDASPPEEVEGELIEVETEVEDFAPAPVLAHARAVALAIACPELADRSEESERDPDTWEALRRVGLAGCDKDRTYTQALNYAVHNLLCMKPRSEEIIDLRRIVERAFSIHHVTAISVIEHAESYFSTHPSIRKIAKEGAHRIRGNITHACPCIGCAYNEFLPMIATTIYVSDESQTLKSVAEIVSRSPNLVKIWLLSAGFHVRRSFKRKKSE